MSDDAFRGVFQQWTFSNKGRGVSQSSRETATSSKTSGMMKAWLAKARENLKARATVVNPNQPAD